MVPVKMPRRAAETEVAASSAKRVASYSRASGCMGWVGGWVGGWVAGDEGGWVGGWGGGWGGCYLLVVEAVLDRVKNGSRGGVMPARGLGHHLFCLGEDNGAADGGVFQNLVEEAFALALGLQSTGGQLFGGVNGHGLKRSRVHHHVRQAHFPRLVGPDVLPCEGHIERSLQPHDGVEVLGAAKARKKACWEGGWVGG